jgi:hypothetical protein
MNFSLRPAARSRIDVSDIMAVGLQMKGGCSRRRLPNNSWRKPVRSQAAGVHIDGADVPLAAGRERRSKCQRIRDVAGVEEIFVMEAGKGRM